MEQEYITRMLACAGILRPPDVTIWTYVSWESLETLTDSVGDAGLLHMLPDDINSSNSLYGN